ISSLAATKSLADPHGITEASSGATLHYTGLTLVLSLTRTGQIERRNDIWQLLPEATPIVSSSVQEIIGTRLGQLSNDAYRLLGVAAVTSNGISAQTLHVVRNGSRESCLMRSM